MYFNTHIYPHTRIHEKLRTKTNPALGHPGHEALNRQGGTPLVAGLSSGTLLSPPPWPWPREEPLTTFAQPSSSLSSSRGLVSDPDVCSKRRNVLIPNGNVYPEKLTGSSAPGDARHTHRHADVVVWETGGGKTHTLHSHIHPTAKDASKRSCRAFSLLHQRKTNSGVGGR